MTIQTCLSKVMHAAVATLLLPCAPAFAAEIYKCTDANGHTVFSETACGANAVQMHVDPQPRFGSTAPRVNGMAAPRIPATNADLMARVQANDAALRCAAEEYYTWSQSQHPRPSMEARSAKAKEIGERCLQKVQAQSAAATLLSGGAPKLSAAGAARR